jgi:hypothetical protein|tara:strand:- start:134 stop:301 length:168 start_codon:yes stop_codon:yes gene_type:complete
MMSDKAKEWNTRQERARDYHDLEGRALRDINTELREIRVLLEALYQHLGGEGKRR